MKSLPALTLLVAFLAPMTLAQTTLGCVDMERCLADYKKAKAQRELLKADIDNKVRAMQEEKRKLDSLKDQLDLYIVGSDEWLELKKKIQVGAAQLEIDGQALEFKAQRRLAELLAKLYEDVRREIKSVAESKGIKLVLLAVNSMPKGRTDTDVTNNIMVRGVLYCEPSLDLTADIIARLNQ